MPSWQGVLVPACQGHSLATPIVLAPLFTAPPLTSLKSVLALTTSPRAASLFGSALGMSCHVPCPSLGRAQPKPHQEVRVPQPSPASVVLASPETRKWEQKTPLGIILVTGEFGKGSSSCLGIDDSQGLVETSNWMGDQQLDGCRKGQRPRPGDVWGQRHPGGRVDPWSWLGGH